LKVTAGKSKSLEIGGDWDSFLSGKLSSNKIVLFIKHGVRISMNVNYLYMKRVEAPEVD
jgi:hypothetical protein